MSDITPIRRPRVPASERFYLEGGCAVCRHEPLGDGRREVVWTEPEEPGSDTLVRFHVVETCPWRTCPQRADEPG